MKDTLKYYLNAIISSYAEILFLQNAKYGVILLFISFFNVNVALSGLIAIVSILVFARFIRMEVAFLENGFYLYNPPLVGMSIGYLFEVSFVSLILIIILFNYLYYFTNPKLLLKDLIKYL